MRKARSHPANDHLLTILDYLKGPVQQQRFGPGQLLLALSGVMTDIAGRPSLLPEAYRFALETAAEHLAVTALPEKDGQ